MAQHGARDFPETVVVGRIIRPHGLRGEVVVEVLSDVAARFSVGSELLLVVRQKSAKRVRIVRSRLHRSRMLVQFAGLEDRDTVEPLRGAFLEVERSAVPEAPPGNYYHFEILNCRCRDRQLGDLGEVVEVLEDGGGLLLLVSDGERNIPIPFVESFIERIDIVRGEIDLSLPPGLVETCASTS